MKTTRISRKTSWSFWTEKSSETSLNETVQQRAMKTDKDNKAEKQKEKAKEMLGIGDDRARELFDDEESHTQKKKKEMKDI